MTKPKLEPVRAWVCVKDNVIIPFIHQTSDFAKKWMSEDERMIEVEIHPVIRSVLPNQYKPSDDSKEKVDRMLRDQEGYIHLPNVCSMVRTSEIRRLEEYRKAMEWLKERHSYVFNGLFGLKGTPLEAIQSAMAKEESRNE